MKVALISPVSMTVHEMCADHELRAWGSKSSKTKVDVINPYPIKSINDVKSFSPDVVVFEKAKGRVFDEYSRHFAKVIDLEGLRELIPKKPEPVMIKEEPKESEPVAVKEEHVPEVVEVAAAAVAEVEEVIQEEEKPKKTRQSKKPTKSSN